MAQTTSIVIVFVILLLAILAIIPLRDVWYRWRLYCLVYDATHTFEALSIRLGDMLTPALDDCINAMNEFANVVRQVEVKEKDIFDELSNS